MDFFFCCFKKLFLTMLLKNELHWLIQNTCYLTVSMGPFQVRRKGESLNFLDDIYFGRLDIYRTNTFYYSIYLSISAKLKFFRSSLYLINKIPSFFLFFFFCLSTTYYNLLYVINRKSSDTSRKTETKTRNFWRTGSKIITLSTQEKEFSTPLSCVED